MGVLGRKVMSRGFTDRQVEYLKLLLEDGNYEDVADQLGVSVKAVKVQLAKIEDRLGARTRTEVAAYAESVYEAIRYLSTEDSDPESDSNNPTVEEDWGW